jgi:hypothetical protein
MFKPVTTRNSRYLRHEIPSAVLEAEDKFLEEFMPAVEFEEEAVMNVGRWNTHNDTLVREKIGEERRDWGVRHRSAEWGEDGVVPSNLWVKLGAFATGRTLENLSAPDRELLSNVQDIIVRPACSTWGISTVISISILFKTPGVLTNSPVAEMSSINFVVCPGDRPSQLTTKVVESRLGFKPTFCKLFTGTEAFAPLVTVTRRTHDASALFDLAWQLREVSANPLRTYMSLIAPTLPIVMEFRDEPTTQLPFALMTQIAKNDRYRLMKRQAINGAGDKCDPDVTAADDRDSVLMCGGCFYLHRDEDDPCIPVDENLPPDFFDEVVPDYYNLDDELYDEEDDYLEGHSVHLFRQVHAQMHYCGGCGTCSITPIAK